MTTILEQISENDLRDFYSKQDDVDWLQTIEFSNLLKTRGWKTSFLGLTEEGDLLATVLLCEKNKRFLINMGPVIDWKDDKLIDQFANNIINYAKNQGACSLTIYPKYILNIRDDNYKITQNYSNKIINIFETYGFKHSTGFRKDYGKNGSSLVYIKNLFGLTVDNVEKTYSQSTRRYIRKAIKAGVTIREMTTEEIPKMRDLIKSSNEKNGANTRGYEYYTNFKKCFGEKAKFVVAEYEGKIISGGVFVIEKNEVVYYEGGSLQEYKRVPAATLVQDYMIKQTIELGKSLYNFYGVHGDAENRGLLNFKAGFRGEIVEYVGEFQKKWIGRILQEKLKKVIKR